MLPKGYSAMNLFRIRSKGMVAHLSAENLAAPGNLKQGCPLADAFEFIRFSYMTVGDNLTMPDWTSSRYHQLTQVGNAIMMLKQDTICSPFHPQLWTSEWRIRNIWRLIDNGNRIGIPINDGMEVRQSYDLAQPALGDL